jgi:LPXTG-motif cell wall-anchored protein
MNVALPGQSSPNAFLMILGISLLISGAILFIFLRRRWF